MVLDDSEIKRLVLDLFKMEAKRDKQRKIGPSEIGNPCDYCIGRSLLGHKQGLSRYWLPAKLGTAMHSLLEDAVSKADTEDYRFERLKGAWTEEKVFIGTLDEYGSINGHVDLYLPGMIIDYKSSTKAKVAKYKLDGVPMQYVYQQQLYAWGLNKEGIYPVDKIALAFVNREGMGDNDVWIYSFDYDINIALRAWERLVSIWEFVRVDPARLEELDSHDTCFYCNQIQHRF